MGQGAYGTVFEGHLDLGNGAKERVVMKRVKRFVHGAEEMVAMEHVLNVAASKAARGSVADFLGFCDVEDHEAARNLTAGLWLVWRFEGTHTLAFYLRRKDALPALARDLGVPEELVIPAAMRQILTGLAALHSGGLVHRDVKPHNIILSEADKRLKLIDLGACADLRGGTNYIPHESILDPLYCPPEQFVLPTNTPHLSKSFVAQALHPVLWAAHKPDRFDTWSAGIILMCLALPALRAPRGLGLFLNELRWAKYDLDRWRATTRWAGPKDLAALDADGGAGWSLARALLRPRSVAVADNGVVSFVGGGGPARLSAPEALRHRYLRAAKQLERERSWAVSSSDSPLSSSDPRDDGEERTLRLRLGGAKAGGTAAQSRGGSAGPSPGGSRPGTRGTGAIGSGGRSPAGSGTWKQALLGRGGGGGSGGGTKEAALDKRSVDGGGGGEVAGGGRRRPAGLLGAAAGALHGLRAGLMSLEARLSPAAAEAEAAGPRGSTQGRRVGVAAHGAAGALLQRGSAARAR
ncbi:MAG: kinase-like domain-containing protein [Monoraphidium minutum]|nr:MAG: kinase-like domain-containing protein [Monoraphidium minutum]